MAHHAWRGASVNKRATQRPACANDLLGIMLVNEGGRMGKINLEDGKINVDGQWLSAEDLANMIQTKMQAGEMKFSDLAAALEELNNALENTETLEVKLVLSKKDYKALQTLGGDDDRESIRKAIMAFIGGNQTEDTPAPGDKKRLAIKCPKCNALFEISSAKRPLDVECSTCGMGGRISKQNKWIKLN